MDTESCHAIILAGKDLVPMHEENGHVDGDVMTEVTPSTKNRSNKRNVEGSGWPNLYALKSYYDFEFDFDA